jgi:hypothetical protein
MNLRYFIGKKVLIQFRPNVGCVVCTAGREGPVPAMMEVQSEQGKQMMPVVLPYLGGVVVQDDKPHAPIQLEFVDQGGKPGSKVRIAIDEDDVMAVSELVEPSSILIG